MTAEYQWDHRVLEMEDNPNMEKEDPAILQYKKRVTNQDSKG